MSKFVLAVFVLVLGYQYSPSAAAPQQEIIPNYYYLGGVSRGLQTTDYYVSSSSGEWQRGLEDCQSNFGDNAAMLSIESAEEQKFVVKRLASFLSGAANVWTDGMYNPIEGVWMWSEIGTEFTYTNWAPGHPGTADGSSRMAIQYQNKFSAFWINKGNTELARYVCKKKTTKPIDISTPSPTTTLDPTLPVICPVVNDLVIILDSSESVGPSNFDLLKKFSADLALAFVATHKSRVAFVVYSETVETPIQIHESESLTNEQILNRIMAAGYQNGPTPTAKAIANATGMLQDNERGEPRTYLVITDGASNNKEKTKEQADAAVAAGIRTFALGITNEIEEDELLNIAGGNSKNVFRSADFSSVVELMAAVSHKICP